MKEETQKIFEELFVRYPNLEIAKSDILAAFKIMYTAYKNNRALFLCGNGGSAADCEHIAGELMKSFKLPRPLPVEFEDRLREAGERGERLAAGLEGGLPAFSLCGHPAFSTAYANDKDSLFVFAQQLVSWGRRGDVLLAISTSGNSSNCVYAAIAAAAKGMKVIALTGGTGGKLKGMSDVSIVAPEKETYKVQELHMPVYHCLCAMLENEFFG